MPVSELEKHAKDLALKYENDINVEEFCQEINSFKFQATELFEGLENLSAFEIFPRIHKYDLVSEFPNIVIALKKFLTVPVTSASCERSFSKLKLIKNYLRSTMAQERLSDLSIISIENEIAQTLDYDEVNTTFAQQKARKVIL